MWGECGERFEEGQQCGAPARAGTVDGGIGECVILAS